MRATPLHLARRPAAPVGTTPSQAAVGRAPQPLASAARRRPAPPVRVAAAEGAAESTEEGGNGFFSPQFLSVLQDSISRQGPEALTSGPARGKEPERKAADEEMIEVSVNHCVDRLQMLERMQKMIENAHAAEVRQLQRLKFVQDKVSSRAAYTKTLKMMVDKRNNGEASGGFSAATGSMIEAWDSEEEEYETAIDQVALLGDPIGSTGSFPASAGLGHQLSSSSPASYASSWDQAAAAADGAAPNGLAPDGTGSSSWDAAAGVDRSRTPSPARGDSAVSSSWNLTGGVDRSRTPSPARGASGTSPLRGRGDGGASRQRSGSAGGDASSGVGDRCRTPSPARGGPSPLRGRGDGGTSRQRNSRR